MAQNIHDKMAVRQCEDGVLTLVSAAKVAQLPVEIFLEKLALLNIVAADYEADKLA